MMAILTILIIKIQKALFILKEIISPSDLSIKRLTLNENKSCLYTEVFYIKSNLIDIHDEVDKLYLIDWKLSVYCTMC